MNVDITMLKRRVDVDNAVLDEPFGICRFNSETADSEWDLGCTEQMRERQATLLPAHGQH